MINIIRIVKKIVTERDTITISQREKTIKINEKVVHSFQSRDWVSDYISFYNFR